MNSFINKKDQFSEHCSRSMQNKTARSIPIFLWLMVLGSSQAGETSIRGCTLFDFESPLQGWQVSGHAFKNQPIFGGNNTAFGHYGNWLINSSSNVTSPCQKSGASIGGSLKGVMTSPLFQIRASNLSFLIGGGCNISTVRVELVIDNKTLFQSTGNCQISMLRKYWDVTGHLGKVAEVRIVDDSDKGVWGYIAFDDLRVTSKCQELQPCTITQSQCPEKKDQSKGFICRCPSNQMRSLPCENEDCPITNGTCQTFCTTTDCKCQQCACSSGFTFNATTLKCDDIDECASNSGGCQHACVNTPGTYRCECQSGYQLDSDNKNCVDINECNLPDQGGCENAECTNSQGSFNCMCKIGWIKNISDPLRCIDRDECAENQLCKDQQQCVNVPGSYKCVCQPGYQLDASKTCIDIDECATSNGGCDQECVNTKSSFRCSCRTGYKLNPDGKTCSDINECETNNGGCQQKCQNTDGGYQCACQRGYLLSNDNVTCLEINECEIDSKCMHICKNTVGGYTCSCHHGYQLQPDNVTCLDVDECLFNKGNCSQLCLNTNGSYGCSCYHGYRLSKDGLTCEDVDECQISNDCQHICTNTKGSYHCSCLSGYEFDKDNKTCRDIDECSSKPKELCEYACINTPGSYDCACPAGLVLNPDNRTCSDVNECRNNKTCQHKCTNLIGSFNCSCFEGFALKPDNQSCEDINECLQEGVCGQKCINTEGRYHCACTDGFKLAYDLRSCVDIDECQVDGTCQENCANLAGSYRCFCSEGKVLQSDGKTCEVPVALPKAIDKARSEIKDASTTTDLIKIMKALTDSLNETKKVSSNELKDTVQVLDQLQSKVMDKLNINSSVESAEILLKNYVGIVSNVLQLDNKESWKNMSGGSSSVASLPGKVEEMSKAIFKLVKHQNMTALNVTVNNENIDLQFEVGKRKCFHGLDYIGKTTRVKLSESVAQNTPDDDYIGVAVVVYKSINVHMSADNSRTKTGTSERVVNSDVISVKLMNVEQDHLATLQDPVTLHFSQKESSNAKLTCCFINETAASLSSGNENMLWASEGCWVNSSHGNTTVCQCNHTTSYGLLMDVHQVYDTLHDTHKQALKYISLIGCSISIVFCFLTVLALTLAMRRPLEKKARFETFKLHINLVIAIGFAQIWFVIGSFLVNVELVACRVVSVFTHYFLTASFCWMLAEGINVYNKIVKVFSTKKYGKFYFTLGWGVPLVLVIVTSAAVFNKYGPQKICWLQEEVIWVFAVPVLVIIVANFFVLLSVVYVLLRKTMAFTSLPNKPKESPKVKRTVKVTVVLLPLLGLTWVFGFLAIDKNFIVFHYLFAIINSLQGFFIFIAHCWINDSIRAALLEKLPSLPDASKYKSGSAEGSQKVTTVDSAAFDTLTQSVPMPVHITMSTVQLLNLGKNAESRTSCEAINDCMEMEQDSQLPGLAQ